MIKLFKEAFYSNHKGASAILSVVLTLILGLPYSLAGNGSLLAFIVMVFIPVVLFAFYREREQGVLQLRDYNFLNIVLTSWVPLLVVALAILF